MKYWVLEQKKEDLELIEAKNMKIQCKNIKHGRAWHWHGRGSNYLEEAKNQRACHGPCLPWHGCARQWCPFCYFCQQVGTARACIGMVIPRFQLPFSVYFWSKSPWVSCGTFYWCISWGLSKFYAINRAVSIHIYSSFVLGNSKWQLFLWTKVLLYFLVIYFYVLLLLLLYVYNEHEWVNFFVLGLLDESNDLIPIKPILEP